MTYTLPPQAISGCTTGYKERCFFSGAVFGLALAVKALAPEMIFAQADLLAQQATNWAARAHHKWFWRGIPDNGYGL